MKKSVKKFLCSLLVVVMCLTSMPLGGLVGLDFGAAKASAASELAASGKCGDNVYWNFDSTTGALTISGKGKMEDYDYGNSPFNYSDIKSVVIESGVTSIGKYAFYCCESLTGVTIPDSVTSIGESAFSCCTSLTSVTIPDSVTSIGDEVFWSCDSLTSVTIPDSVTGIGELAFRNCTSLTSVTIPYSVTRIGDEVFCGCTNLTSITVDSNNTKYSSDSYGVLFNKDKTEIIQYPAGNARTSYIIPESVTRIGDVAFFVCTNLTSIVIPDSVTSIGIEVFLGCTSLSSITVDSNNTEYSSDECGVLFDKDKTILIQYPGGRNTTEYVVPKTVKAIGIMAFAGTIYLEKVTLPEGLTTIEDEAFDDCFSLSEIKLPDSLITIGESSFYECMNLTEITLPNNLEHLYSMAITDCLFLEKIYVKSMNTIFDRWALEFSDFKVEGISREEFHDLLIDYCKTGNKKYAEYLKRLDDPIAISTIYCHSGSTAEAYAIANDMPYVLTHFFEGDCIYDYDKMICYRKCIHCDEREEISIDSSFEESRQCGDNAYWSYDDNTGKLDITGTGDMWNFTNSPFRHMNIKSIAIEDGITSIGDYAFAKCYNLTDITIGNGEISIGDHAFYCCEKLSNVAIPDSVVSIGDYSFGNCKGLTDVTIGKGVTSIGDYVFYGCKALTGITVDKNNTKYSSDEYGVLFDKDKTILIQYPVGRKTTEYVVPKTVKTIGKRAFVGTIYLEKVVLPEGLTTIDDEAFYQCYSLSTIELPESLKKVGLGSFTECYSISEITFPENLETINEFAIYYCLFMDKIYFKSMSTVFTDLSVGYSTIDIEDISKEEFIKLFINYLETDDEKYMEYLKELEDPITIGTIYCHSGSTAEAYAIANNMPYVLTHFFEGDWTYDYDKMIRYRKCIHCDELETEPLETTEKGDTEIIAPADPDTDFNVDEVKPGSDNYIMVEESFHHHGPEHWHIVKAFDITMTGKDGVHTQPDGTVKVKIPGNWSKHGVYKVYRVNDDGTLTDMHAYRQGSHLVFDTDHFSLYVVVDESDTSDTDSDTPSGGENDSFISRLFAFITRIIEMISSWFKK